MSSSQSDPVPACLALQGGGAHGAYAWGLADRLIEQGLQPAAISGVSSGALLGVAIAQGWARNGPDGARAEMRRLWVRVGQAHNSLLATMQNWMSRWAGNWGGSWPGMGQGWDASAFLGQALGPAQMNPLGHNPLRAIVADLLDPAALTAPEAVPLTITATDAETGLGLAFDNHSITVDTLLASCCLPMLFAPVRLSTPQGDRLGWDGAFAGNPPLQPLLRPGLPPHIVLLRAQPRRRAEVPTNPTDILNRIHELAFANVLDVELAHLPPGIRLTSHDADAALGDLPLSSKLDMDPNFLERLFQAGRAAIGT